MPIESSALIACAIAAKYIGRSRSPLPASNRSARPLPGIGAPLDPRRNRPALEGLAHYLVRAPVRHAQLLGDLGPSEHAELSADSDHKAGGMGVRSKPMIDQATPQSCLLRLQRPDLVTGATVERRSGLGLLARLSLHVPKAIPKPGWLTPATPRCALLSPRLQGRRAEVGPGSVGPTASCPGPDPP